MNTKQIIAASVAALALAISGAALAESETSVLVSGDEPMNEGMAAEITEPAPDAAAQAKTAEMLKEGRPDEKRMNTLLTLQREALLSNPLIDFGELLVVRRSVR